MGTTRRLILLAGACVMSGSVLAQAAEPPLQLRPPARAEVAWRGMLPTEGGGVGAGGAMLYPAAGPAGFLVAVLAHAALSSGAQSAERRREQEAADKVLEPYLPALKAWPSSALWQHVASLDTGLALHAPDGPPAGTPLLQAVPQYAMSQDESVLVLDALVKLELPGRPEPTETMVRVVSSPLAVDDRRAHWSADDSARLKATAAAMLAHAIRLSHRHAGASDAEPAPMRTHRYRFGALERTERAQQLEAPCGRAVLRNLRGWLMSVPVATSADPVAACSPAAAF